VETTQPFLEHRSSAAWRLPGRRDRYSLPWSSRS